MYLVGDYMIIYIDTLVFTNIIVDYLLLSATSLILRRNIRLRRIIPASVLGGLGSLYIFVESEYLLLDIVFKLAIGFLIIIIAVGISKLKTFVYFYLVFLLLSFTLNGLILFLQNITSKESFFSNNLISYINLSPLYLIAATMIIYLLVRLFQRIFDRKNNTGSAELLVTMLGKTESYKALIDTGNHVFDPFGNSQVFILDADAYNKFFGTYNKKEIENRYRIIPVITIESKGLLHGIRCDSASINAQNNSYHFTNPIVVSSKVPIANGFTAIIAASSIDRISD